jgi:hypothetical protein
LNHVAKQAQTLFRIGRGKISDRLGVSSMKSGSIENNKLVSSIEIISKNLQES